MSENDKNMLSCNSLEHMTGFESEDDLYDVGPLLRINSALSFESKNSICDDKDVENSTKVYTTLTNKASQDKR